MKTFNTRLRTLAAGISLAVLAGGAAVADPAYFGDRHRSDGYARSADFRMDNPVKVFVNVDAKGRRDRQEDRLENVTERAMRENMPGYVRLVDSPRYADITITVREQDFDMDRRIVDRDREDERYKKVNLRTGNGCGPLYKVSYTVVKERVESKARYSVQVQTEGVGRERERITAKADAYLTYGEDLRAHTRCSAEPTKRFPNRNVAALFEKNSPENRRQLLLQVQRETAADLGRKLAVEIRSNVDDYYASLAVRYAHGGHFGSPWQGKGKHKPSHGRWD